MAGWCGEVGGPVIGRRRRVGGHEDERRGRRGVPHVRMGALGVPPVVPGRGAGPAVRKPWLPELAKAMRAEGEAPAAFVEIGKAAFTWHTVDADLATLTHDSADHPTGALRAADGRNVLTAWTTT